METEVAKKLLNRMVVDQYGNLFGKISGFISKKNEVVSIGIITSDGNLINLSSEKISLKGEFIMTTSQWKDEGKKIAEQIDDSLREISALKKIRDADEISEDIYEKLFKERRNIIEELYDKVENLITIMAERIKVLESRILDYTVFLANINMNKILGEVDEEAYETSKRELSKYLSRINLEKQDLEKTINALKIYIDNSRSQEAISAISTHSIPITIKIKEAEGV